MSTTIAATSSTASTTASSTQSTDSTSTLGKDDFLKMLVTQLQNQDPMQPMEDKEFIAQMAQFSSLEQIQNMNSSLVMAQATNLIGKTVTWNDSDGEQQGKVSSVLVVNGKPQLTVGQTAVALDQITGVQDAESA